MGPATQGDFLTISLYTSKKLSCCLRGSSGRRGVPALVLEPLAACLPARGEVVPKL